MVLVRVRRTRKGDFKIVVTADEREVLRGLPPQLRSLLAQEEIGSVASSGPVHARLFPDAFLDDPEQSKVFADLVHDDLKAQRLASLEIFEQTLDATRLTEEELLAWLAVLNDLRLVLGVRLDLTETTTDADFADGSDERSLFSLYRFLSFLVGEIVESLSP